MRASMLHQSLALLRVTPRSALIVLLCLRVLADVPAAQTSGGPQQPQAAFRAGVDVVSLNVTVRNRSNKAIPDLNAADFVVFEDGRPQPLIEVSRRRLPLSLTFLMDSSSSMTDKLDMARAAASEFVRRLGVDDQASVVGFDSRVRASGSTALFNAIYIGLKDLERFKASAPEDLRRQAIVVLSDGDDTASTLNFDDVLDLAKRSHTSIYAIGIRPNIVPGLSRDSDGDFVLRHLARDTGGTAFFPQEPRELPRIYREVADELASEYLVAYTSTNAVHDGKWRNVSVRVARADTVARTRPGYFAPSQ